MFSVLDFFASTSILWIGSEIWNNIHYRVKVDKSKDKGSAVFLWISIYAGVFLGILFSSINTSNPSSTQDLRVLAGSCIIWFGVIIRTWAIKTLGTFFTPTIAVQEKQKIITWGPYKYVRHPSYTGGFISFLGLGIALGSVTGFALMIILIFMGYKRRMDVEEKVMLSSFGDEYRSLMLKTKRLIPYVY
jgi:protein-S-isoprenylcysteine O-methyltransferase